MKSGPGRRKFLQVSLGTVGSLMAGCDGGAVGSGPAGSGRAPGNAAASGDAPGGGEGGISEGGSPEGGISDGGLTDAEDAAAEVADGAAGEPEPAKQKVPGSEVFELSPMAAEVTGSSAILWAKTKVPCAVRFEISLTPELDSPRRTPTVTTRADQGLSCKVPVAGLTPGKRYHYRPVAITGGGEIAGQAGRFYTLPAENLSLRLVWGADLLASSRPFRICDTIAKLEPDLLLLLGDTTYADWPKSRPPAATLAEFREKQMDVRRSPHLQRLLSRVASYTVWDDHEVGNNDDRKHPSFRLGRQAFLEHWPLAVAGDGGFYRSFTWGTLLEVLILDCRSFRSPATMKDGPSKSMLGPIQKRWLLGALARSTARYKVIASSVPFLSPFGTDCWHGYAHERDQIMEAAKKGGAGPVFVASADFHLAWDLADDKHAFRELICGPLGAFTFQSARPKALVDKVLESKRFSMVDELNFGVLELETLGGPRLTAKIVDAKGKVRHRVDLG